MASARGVGLSALRGLPNGMGYPQVAARQLKALAYDVSLANLGIPTAVIGPDFQALGQQFGRFTLGNSSPASCRSVRTNANAGDDFRAENEITSLTAALGGGAGAGDQAGYIGRTGEGVRRPD